MGTVNNRPYSYTVYLHFGTKMLLLTMEPLFFTYYSMLVKQAMLRQIIPAFFTSFNPVSPSALWVDKGSTYFGQCNEYSLGFRRKSLNLGFRYRWRYHPRLSRFRYDNDGCPDAIEGGANFTNSDLVTSQC